MAVRTLWVGGESLDVRAAAATLPEAFHELVEFAILASQRDPFDPMEQAFKRLGDRFLAQTEHLHEDWTLVREYPLSPELLAMSHVWRSRGRRRLRDRGEGRAGGDRRPLPPRRRRARSSCRATSRRWPTRGCACSASRGRRSAPQALPGDQHDFAFEFLGLVGLEDPVRPTAARRCRSAARPASAW